MMFFKQAHNQGETDKKKPFLINEVNAAEVAKQYHVAQITSLL